MTISLPGGLRWCSTVVCLLLAFRSCSLCEARDLLSALHKENARELFAIMIIFFAATNAPMTWKKAQFAQAINWCGWTVDFEMDTIQLIGNKLTKLQGQIDALLKTKKVDRNALEKCIGLLVWATSISSHLRPFLAPLYSDLNSPPRFFMPWKAKFLEYAGRRIYSKDDLPEVGQGNRSIGLSYNPLSGLAGVPQMAETLPQP